MATIPETHGILAVASSAGDEEVAADPDKGLKVLGLTDREIAAYKWTLNEVKKTPERRLSPQKGAELFALYLQGISCFELARLNKGISLGQIVYARVEQEWDRQRTIHINTLMAEVRTRVQQTHLEGVDFIATQLAVAHKLYGDKLKEYLQTGDESKLGGFSIHSFRTYKEAVEIMKLLTASEVERRDVTGDITHHHVVEGGGPTPVASQELTPAAAQSIISAFVAKKKQNQEE